MKEVGLIVKENNLVATDTYKLVLSGDCKNNEAGQFVEIKLDGFTLRRPFGVCDSDQDSLTILYKVAGQGTRYMTSLEKGQALNVLTSLGRGFDLSLAKKPLIIGGGMGIAPLYKLAKEFKRKDIPLNILLGFKDTAELCLLDEFSKLGNVMVCTDNGSYGYKGNVISALKNFEKDYDFYYACGPYPMLKALTEYDKRGQVSLEARMGCGFGACMGCTIKTTDGYKRVCKEGPVFMAQEVIFDE